MNALSRRHWQRGDEATHDVPMRRGSDLGPQTDSDDLGDLAGGGRAKPEPCDENDGVDEVGPS